jgi:hypothetical protein
MRYLFESLCVCALAVMLLVGCSESGGGGGTGGTGGADLCEGVACDDGNECTKDECRPANGSCSNTAVDDGAFCDAGYCQSGQCEPIASVFPCDEQGILEAVAAGGGPHGFGCDGPTVVTTMAEIIIDNDVILDGRGNLSVDGNDDHIVFSVPINITAALRRFTVTGGFSMGDLNGSGSGVANEGTLSLTNSTVSGNSTGETGGGGIWNRGTMTVSNSTVSDNSAGNVGFGGIWNRGTMTVSNSTVSGNSAGTFGINGVFNDEGMLTVLNSTVSGNTGGSYGAIVNEAVMALSNSTVSGNNGEASGAILNGGGATLTITNSTVSGNAAATGASIVNYFDDMISAELTIANSVVDGDCEGIPQGVPNITSLGYNIESPGNTCGFDHGADLVSIAEGQLDLGVLADNGGPTMTHALGADSVAIDHIPAVDCGVTTDQRGQPRPEPGGSMCDVGAFEVQLKP